jgi:hypothetical protein
MPAPEFGEILPEVPEPLFSANAGAAVRRAAAANATIILFIGVPSYFFFLPMENNLRLEAFRCDVQFKPRLIAPFKVIGPGKPRLSTYQLPWTRLR